MRIRKYIIKNKDNGLNGNENRNATVQHTIENTRYRGHKWVINYMEKVHKNMLLSPLEY